LAIGIGAASPLAAQPIDDPAGASELFNDARALVEEGKWDEGCPKFQASIKLHASSSTAINIARCEIHYGRVASAWTLYHQALTLIPETEGVERQKALEEVAKKEMADVEARVPHLTIHIEGAPEMGLDVRRDTLPMERATLDTRLPIDPGPHEIVVRAPGRRTAKESIVLSEGEDKTVPIVLALDTVPEEAKPATGVAQASLPAWPFIVGAAGLVAGAVAAGFLANDVSASNALRANCYRDATGTGCKPGYDFASDNRRKNVSGGVALGFGIAGIGLLVTGAVGVVVSAATNDTRGPAKGASAFLHGASLVPILSETTVGLGVVGSL
jgi:hypothetical protein